MAQTEYDLSDYDVTYINYEKISRDKSICYKSFDCIVLDEVHKIKGKSTNTSTRIRNLSRKATYVWGLTGTPVANNYADVYNIYRNMSITEFEMTYNQFCAEYYYVRPLERGIYSIPILIAPKQFKLPELMERIGNHSLTKQAKDCIELPEKTTNVHRIDGMRTMDYIRVEDGILEVGNESRTMIKLEAINKAHQAANGFVYYRDNAVEITENDGKLEKLAELTEKYLEETPKLIIVYYYKEDYNQIVRKLSPDYFVTTDISLFKSDGQILLLQYGQAEGLNLQFCNHMIYYTYDYSYLKYDQMCGRIYRNGQENKVTYDILINAGTIEEKIWKAIATKQNVDEFLKETLTANG